MLYFAYGSNMSPERLRVRVPNARPIGVYLLKGHDLRCHKIGKDGSAKCNAHYTGMEQDVVEGVVYDIHPDEVVNLDNVEGLGDGYEKKLVLVKDAHGARLEAFTYVATRTDDSLRPFSWYKIHVLEGGRRAGLSFEYIAKIEGWQTEKDTNRQREQMELMIYR